MQAILALEDGRIFRGQGYGHPGECQGEVVFNTSLTGYQEIATDPSYAGQIVVLTNPQIGNYGTNQADNESAKPYIEGLIVREFSAISSNWRSEQVTDEYMERYSVPVLAEIDTRALVRHLRTHGVMRGVISTTEIETPTRSSRRPEASARWTGRIWRGWSRQSRSTPSTRTISRNQTGDPLLAAVLAAETERASSPRGGVRLRHQAEHPAHADARGLPGDGGSGGDDGGRCAGAEAGRRFSVERAGRSGAGRLCREGDPRA